MTDKIPFDVELWKTGKYDVINGSGIEIKSLLIHNIECTFPITVILGNGCNENYMINGDLDGRDDDDEKLDNIYLIPRKRKVWIAVYKRDCPFTTTLAYESRAELISNGLDINSMENWHIIEVELPQ